MRFENIRINAVGVRDGDRIIQRWVDDLRLCMLLHGDVELEDDGARIGRIDSGGFVVLESELDGRLQSLTISNDGDGEQMTWTVDGASRQVDAEVERSSLRGERSSLQGEISSARGHVSSLNGQISSERGHVSSLKGEISSHNGAISGLEASRYDATEEDLAVIEAAIRRHEEAIGEIEQQVEDYDLDGRVAEIERQIEELDVEGKVEEIEERLEPALRELRRTIEAIGG